MRAGVVEDAADESETAPSLVFTGAGRISTQHSKPKPRKEGLMKTKVLKWSVIAFIPAAMLALSSCSSAPKGKTTTTTIYEEGVPGGVVVQTHETTATVTGIDATKREVTLVSPDGKRTSVKCGPEVRNFGQIHIGDQVKATVAEQLVIYMAKDQPPAAQGQSALMARAPEGAKPGALMANTVQLVAKVTAIDLKHHKATLQFPDGTSKTVAVRKDVDLTQRQVGEEVVIRCTQALAVSVEKP